MTAPKWAQDLVLRVALDEEKDDVPNLGWWRARKRKTWAGLRPAHAMSSGRSWPTKNRIHVTAGTDRKDQKLVLLHELAHWLSPPTEHHGPTFWDTAWRLYRTYKVPLTYAKVREGNYRKGALVAARKRS